MIGRNAFCPRTGAPLSDEREYDDHGRSERATVPDEFTPDARVPGELTNGSVTSSTAALFNQFRRSHQRHAAPNEWLYRKAALALRRLRSTAEGRANWAVHIWYALHQRLHGKGFDVDWMHAHADLRCPNCHGRLKYESSDDGGVCALCGTSCTEDGADRLRAIRTLLSSLYTQSFSEPTTAEAFLRFDDCE